MPASEHSSISRDLIAQIVGEYIDPYTQEPLAYTDFVASVETNTESDSAEIRVDIMLGYPAAGIIDEYQQAVAQHVKDALLAKGQSADLVQSIKLHIIVAYQVASHTRSSNVAGLEQVKNIIAIASGKGGVGKSATALNIALALHQEGATVALLDADIYGPSQPLMLGIPPEQRPEVREQKYFYPIEAHGLQTMSMGYLVTEKTPMVWRGPMVSGALTQMVNQTLWRNVDYLIVDMPPGTGDIQLTLSQQVPVTGSAIVTTPQDIALLDAKKGIEMFRKVNIPCLGIIENMATHICSQCGHNEAIFGDGGGERIAKEYDVPLLGSLPLSMEIRKGLDEGKPTVATNRDSELAKQYRQIARQLAAQLCLPERKQSRAAPKIVVSND